MKKIWSYRFYFLIILGQAITWTNISDSWYNNLHFALIIIGILIAFVGTMLQIKNK